jgi:hypothetical protein
MAILVKKIHITEDNEYYIIHESSNTKVIRCTYCRKEPDRATDDPLNGYEETIKMLCEYLLIRQAREVSPCEKGVG